MYVQKNVYQLKGFMKMNDRCPVCGQPLNIEPGFYYGTNMTSYALAVVISAFSLLLWWLTIGISLDDSRFFWWMGINALLLVVLQPPLMRWSRAIWLAIIVPYSPDWDKGDVVLPERVNKDQENNW